MASTDLAGGGERERRQLERMYAELSRAFYDKDTPARDKAALSRQMLTVMANISRLDDGDDNSGGFDDGGTEAFDPQAV